MEFFELKSLKRFRKIQNILEYSIERELFTELLDIHIAVGILSSSVLFGTKIKRQQFAPTLIKFMFHTNFVKVTIDAGGIGIFNGQGIFKLNFTTVARTSSTDKISSN